MELICKISDLRVQFSTSYNSHLRNLRIVPDFQATPIFYAGNSLDCSEIRVLQSTNHTNKGETS